MEMMGSCPLILLVDFNDVPINVSPLQIQPFLCPSMVLSRVGSDREEAALTAAARRREGERRWMRQGVFTDSGLTQLGNFSLWNSCSVWEWELSVQSMGTSNLSFCQRSGVKESCLRRAGLFS